MNLCTKPRPVLRAVATLFGSVACCAPLTAGAGALTDGSMGAVQSLSGRFTVPQSLGTLKGSNLFHSFTRFGIASGEAATFSTSDPGIRNVISRVTGGEASLFQGLLKLDAAGGSRPDFFFVNPSGITIGAGAVIDVPAGLHLSTAPQLKFADGFVWDTRGGTSALSVAAPESFGFLGGQSAAALRWSDTSLDLQPGSTLELVAGEISLERSVLTAAEGRIALRAPGAVEIADGAGLQASSGAGSASGGVRVDAGSLRIDRRGGDSTVIFSETTAGSSAAGGIELNVAGALTLAGGAQVLTYQGSTSGPGGHIRISADSMAIDGQNPTSSIASWVLDRSEGSGITIDVAGRLSLSGSAQVFTSTVADGGSGRVSVRAGSLALDGLGSGLAFIGSQALSGGIGAGGPVSVQVRDGLSIAGGGQIGSYTSGIGKAGDVRVDAASLVVDARHGFRQTGVLSNGDWGAVGAVEVVAADSIDLLNGGSIASSGSGLGTPGPVHVQARTITLDGDGRSPSQIVGVSFGDVRAASVQVDASDSLFIRNGGQISSSTLGAGDASSVQVSAPVIDISGRPGPVTGIFSNALDSGAGNAGDITVQASLLTLSSSGRISATTSADSGGAGTITVRADHIAVDGGGVATGFESYGFGRASNAGTIRIEARDQLSLVDGGSILSGALGSGNPGELVVKAGTLLIDGKGAPERFTGIGGDALGLGAAGAVAVDATRISIREGGMISSSTYSSAAAGAVRVTTDVLDIDGGGNSTTASGISADTGAAGRGGNIDIKAREVTINNEGMISSSALDSGAGGAIRIDAAQISMDKVGGVYSIAAGRGDAGSIDVDVSGAIVLAGGSGFVANTGGAGAAGRIRISAGSFTAGGSDDSGAFFSRVVSRARVGSGGQTGSITLDIAGSLNLSDGALLSIANEMRVADPTLLQPTSLIVRAGDIHLDHAEITAASSANGNAGRIALSTPGRLRLDSSSIRTSAVDGDGGAIAIDAGGTAWLRDSSITTSVTGRSNGNGGDIALRAGALLLQSGFVQANTAAPLARGGHVDIGVAVLVPDGSQVFIGGSRIEEFRAGVPGFNVIQAAAPDGLGGVLDVSLPQLNLSSSLAGLSTQRIDFGALGRDICQVGYDGSFTILGRGAIPTPASGPLRVRP